MASDLIFYTTPMSRGRIVRWMLEESGADYETVVVDYGPTMKAEPFRSINPMGKVPAIVHHGQAVTECAGICAYLADVFPDAGLGPREGEKAAYYRW
ncbi:glutathione S-transferase N-terminal domain-containing protein, partial [Streptococcus suis]